MNCNIAIAKLQFRIHITNPNNYDHREYGNNSYKNGSIRIRYETRAFINGWSREEPKSVLYLP